jgi:DNA polymerase-3 subunit gamma/tau
MSYQVLARKWRPKDFGSLVGQEHVVRALRHALEQKRLHHAYLFTGTRGVGKTTLARILAKCLNCETGITAQPCNKCSACVQIDTGRFPDYVELDAASNRGVDEMTQLLERSVYAPTAGRFKVYVIDEVHQLSGHAFNAMLKTLEEPPEHLKFILATTDPQKIPVTVLSRCLQFNLKQMPREAIRAHLEGLLKEEKISFEGEALSLIGRAAAGSMRDALSLLDQAIAHGGGKVTTAGVGEMLGAIDQGFLRAYSRRCFRRCGGRSRGRHGHAGAQPFLRHSARRSREPAAQARSRTIRHPKRSKRICRNARACWSSRAFRSGNGAALLPDHAAGQGGSAARSR